MTRPILLIVDDEESVRHSFKLVLEKDYELVFAEDARGTLQAIKRQNFDLCLLDIMLPDGSGLDLLRQMKRRDADLDVIMVTALSGVETALTAMKGEAQDYITKPFKIDELRGLIQKVLFQRSLKKERNSSNHHAPLCLTGTGKVMKALVKKAETIAESNEPVWLMGEKGSCLDDIAYEIHRRSERKQGPFITLNCSSMPKNRLEAELFGEAVKGRLPQVGKLEFAHGGTLFLGHVDRLPLTLQSRLVEVFTSKNLSRLGSEDKVPADVRLIVSSGMELQSGDTSRIFVKHFYRLISDTIIALPPLRERKGDIPLLIDRVLQETNPKTRVPVKSIRNEVVQLLSRYTWPGNLEELRKSVGTMVFFAGKDNLTLDDVPLDILIGQMDLAKTKQDIKFSLKQLHHQFEHQYIRKVLENTQGNQTRTAETLGLHRNTLIGKLKKLNLEDYYKDIVRKRRERGVQV